MLRRIPASSTSCLGRIQNGTHLTFDQIIDDNCFHSTCKSLGQMMQGRCRLARWSHQWCPRHWQPDQLNTWPSSSFWSLSFMIINNLMCASTSPRVIAVSVCISISFFSNDRGRDIIFFFFTFHNYFSCRVNVDSRPSLWLTSLDLALLYCEEIHLENKTAWDVVSLQKKRKWKRRPCPDQRGSKFWPRLTKVLKPCSTLDQCRRESCPSKVEHISEADMPWNSNQQWRASCWCWPLKVVGTRQVVTCRSLSAWMGASVGRGRMVS